MPTTKNYYNWAQKYYVATRKNTNAAGQPVAYAGPYATEPTVEFVEELKQQSGDETLHVMLRDINRMEIRPTRIDPTLEELTEQHGLVMPK